MLDSHACRHLNAIFNDSFVHVAAKLLQASLHRTHQAFGRAHINPSRMQLRHVHERSATRRNLLLPKFTDIKFSIANTRKSDIAVPRNARECRRQTFFATKAVNHAGQATVRSHAERVHLRKINREQSHLRAIWLCSQRLRIFDKGLQVKIAISIAIHNQKASTIAFIVNALERAGSPEDIGQLNPNFFET